MEHKMKLWNDYFSKIKYGKKDIELRLNDQKRQMIKVGDIIVFTNNLSKEEVRCEVIALHHFKSFEELYNAFDKTRFGYLPEEEASYKDMERFYLKEEIKKYGVVGIEIKKML